MLKDPIKAPGIYASILIGSFESQLSLYFIHHNHGAIVTSPTRFIDSPISVLYSNQTPNLPFC
ncbi:hypothetical protein SAMN05661044_00264 [Olivibacter domesticus]|uniref:Uncharacterized protein n=1 Tax=Olivibacter domesticus TaxID=407022 RepID=A0A1H7H2S3_OLID1|nr:hypothetical protein SAMN05661044_00264 [Olivibacter domesticus]